MSLKSLACLNTLADGQAPRMCPQTNSIGTVDVVSIPSLMGRLLGFWHSMAKLS